MCVCVCLLCGCGCVVGSTRVSPDAASSLLHHLLGANMCVAHDLKITFFKYMYMSASLFFFLLILLMKKNGLKHLLSMMSAFRSLWPSTMVPCVLLLVAVSSTFQNSSPT